MNPKTVQFQYDINRMNAVNLVATIHIDDYDTRFLELILSNEGSPLNVDGCTVTARFVTAREKYLLRDDVPCVAEGSTITIPIDAAAVNNMACDIKIEVNIVDGAKVLTLPFPLWIRVRGSILDDAQVTPESEGTIPDLLKAAQETLDAAAAALEEAGNYESLDNKPQINGHTLSGNKTSSELGLQDKLTAGDNVTIDESGVISATGGTDDYNELSNKPRISGGGLSPQDLTGTILFESSDFYNQNIVGERVSIKINKRYFSVEFLVYGIVYDFNNIPEIYYHAGMNRFIEPFTQISNFPESLNDIDRTKPYYVVHYTDRRFPDLDWIVRKIIGFNQNGDYVEYAQLISVRFPEDNKAKVVDQTPWQKITGGSEIASAAVNQNGTITFFDENGNPLFTTTGASVIGPQGAPGQDYVLTPQDKTDIANEVLELLPNADTMLFPEASEVNN